MIPKNQNLGSSLQTILWSSSDLHLKELVSILFFATPMTIQTKIPVSQFHVF